MNKLLLYMICCVLVWESGLRRSLNKTLAGTSDPANHCSAAPTLTGGRPPPFYTTRIMWEKHVLMQFLLASLLIKANVSSEVERGEMRKKYWGLKHLSARARDSFIPLDLNTRTVVKLCFRVRWYEDRSGRFNCSSWGNMIKWVLQATLET